MLALPIRLHSPFNASIPQKYAFYAHLGFSLPTKVVAADWKPSKDSMREGPRSLSLPALMKRHYKCRPSAP